MDQKTLDDWVRRYPTSTVGDDGLTAVTTVALISFCHLDKPHAKKGSTREPRYQCAVILPPNSDHSALDNAARTAWQISPWANTKPKSKPLKDQKPMKDAGYKGFNDTGFFFNCDTKNPPSIFGIESDGKGSVAPIPADQTYSGMYARVKVRAEAFSVDGNTGVKFWIQSVQKIADGEKLGGSNPSDGYEAVNAPKGNAPASMPQSNGASVGW
jgi:hypothetical protein